MHASGKQVNRVMRIRSENIECTFVSQYVGNTITVVNKALKMMHVPRGCEMNGVCRVTERRNLSVDQEI